MPMNIFIMSLHLILCT
uniref:Uncharacterized protein n=1 Tax=Rhizophora mucronata TaxID=61149 RepID=A0A2P2QBP4_RHIMU